MAAKTLSAKDLAEKLETDAKTLRRFLRKRGMGVGQGNRYEIDSTSVNRLKKDFAKWVAEEAAKKAAREAEKTRKADNKVTDDEIAEETHEDNEEEPTESDLQDIQAEEAEEL